LQNGIKSTLKCMTKIPNLKSAGYWAATVTTCGFQVANLVESMNIMLSGSFSFMLGIRLCRLAKFMLLTTILFTLKDAADRDRLEGTTFIELNFLSSVSLATWAAFVFKEAGTLTPFGAGLSIFSLFSAFNGVASVMKKKS